VHSLARSDTMPLSDYSGRWLPSSLARLGRE
jgi:hypothetical protein